jgi:hypothetical protein
VRNNLAGEKEEIMKKTVVRIFAGLLIVSGVLIWNPSTKSRPAVALAESNGCRLTMLNGTYGFAFSGYFNSGSSDAPAYTPLAAAGTITFRPGGTLNRTFNISFGGTIFPVGDMGTYSLDSNSCNFTATLPEAGETWNLIPVEGGLQINFFVNPGPRIGAGTMTHQ